jgi:predicted DNA-binding transcriptional regulator AlpA
VSSSCLPSKCANRSNMWLWRVREGDPDFPKPLQINGRNYWRIADLLAWEGRRLANAS